MKNFVRRFFAKEAPKADAENDAEIYVYKSQDNISTIIITTLGVDPMHLEEIIVTTKKKLPRENERLVYITDNSDFTVFRRHGVIFEYLPPLMEQRLHAADMPWRAYLRERWGLLVAKWRPRRVLAYGTNVDSFIAAAPAPATRNAPDMPSS